MDDVSQVPIYMARYGKEWAAENPQEALEWVLERHTIHALSGIPRPLTPNPWGSELIIRLDDALGRDGSGFYNAVSIPIRALAASDPQQAIAALEALPYAHTRSLIAPEIAAEWAKFDREAARAWSQTLPGKYARDLASALTSGKPLPNGSASYQ